MGGANGGGGRAARALRLLLLLVLTLAAVEYLFGSILDASTIRTYLYTPPHNASQMSHSTSGIRILGPWRKEQPSTTESIQRNSTSKFVTSKIITNTSLSIVDKVDTNVDIVNNSTNKTCMENSTREDIISTAPPMLLVTKIIDSIRNASSTEENNNRNDTILCDEMPPDLGPISANKSKMELSEVQEKYPEVQLGGIYSPSNCTPRHKVAIIVPFRDREEHLAIFLNHMHPFLMKQQIEYGIYIVEQKGKRAFNRAKLMNVGFKESQRLKEGGWQCFIFHDIDLLPLDERNMYSCPRQPRHMSASIDKLHFKLPYEEIFGGVSAMTLEQFTKVNGFSNKYWGWGGEDDDMYYRLKRMNYHLSRYKMSIARYAMLDHKKSSPNPKRFQLLSQTTKTFQKDGLSNLKYEVVKVVKYHLHTQIIVNIDANS